MDREIEKRTDPHQAIRERSERVTPLMKQKLVPDGVEVVHDEKQTLWLDSLFSDANKLKLATFAQRTMPKGNETATAARAANTAFRKHASGALVKLEASLQ